MYQYIIRRILVFIPMLIALSIVVFALAKAAPGDPFTGKLLDPEVDPEVFEEMREELGLNKPVHVQYFDWISRFAKGDFGESITYNGRTVQSLIVERFDNTFRVGVFSLFLALIVAIPIGLYSARNRYSILDY